MKDVRFVTKATNFGAKTGSGQIKLTFECGYLSKHVQVWPGRVICAMGFKNVAGSKLPIFFVN